MCALVQNLMGRAVGPVLTGALPDRWGLTAALATVAVLGVPAGMVLWWGSRSYGRDWARVGRTLSPTRTGRLQAAGARPAPRRGPEASDDPRAVRPGPRGHPAARSRAHEPAGGAGGARRGCAG